MKAIFVLFLFALATCQTLVGGWTKRSFEENDMLIDRSRVLVEKKFFEEQNLNEGDAEITPIAIYSQLVNGYNFKIVFAARLRATNEFSLYEYKVYCGPFGSQEVNSPKITATKQLAKGKPLLFAAAQYTNIHKAIMAYYSTQNSLNYVSKVERYEAPLDDMNIFVAYAKVGETQEVKTCVLIEENDELQQVAEIRSF